MRRFLVKLAWFLAPFAMAVVAFYAIDPYNYLGVSPLVGAEARRRGFNPYPELKPFGNTLWKMIEYHRAPAADVVIGDSRANDLDYVHLSRVAGRPFYNFGLPGGDCVSACDTFWFAARRMNLRAVYMGISFTTYNGYIDRKIFATPEKIFRNPLYYPLDRAVWRTAWNIVEAEAMGRTPSVTRRTWQEVLRDTEEESYAQWTYPTAVHRRLVEIAAYCRSNRIQLTFILFPTSTEQQGLVAAHRLTKEAERFRTDLAALAPVYDFDYPNEITLDRAKFLDPLHTRPEIRAKLVEEIWTGKPYFARLLGGEAPRDHPHLAL